MLVLVALAVGFGAVILNLASTGKSPGSARMATFPQSPHYKDGKFINPIPTEMMVKGNYWDVTSRYLRSNGDDRKPRHPIPVQALRRSSFSGAPGQAIQVYWLGHASVLLEMAGKRFLLDPVFSERASMVQWAGPRRLHPSPIGLDEIPDVDAVLISHNHYDHLDYATIQALAKRPVTFYVPLGVGETLESWGCRRDQIVELDWWGERTQDNVQIVCAPARHFSGRGLFDRDKTLWASWCLLAEGQRVYFGGDSGQMPTYRDIGEKYGPFDLTILPIGAYDEAWIEIHTTPEQAAEAHQLVKGGVMLPIHWATFDLALHTWAEPIERLVKAAEKQRIQLVTPRVGEQVTLSAPQTTSFWWRR
jgi:L-ascorbate metabolism protein UlaG (beta-lactamase superfamily)